ncbi:MAG: hypothetical protein QOG64_1002, partial [Acidimicrobiaceae bacterium]|nr:hypothetical protein [Acidimicrobiaceae bacterium]
MIIRRLIVTGDPPLALDLHPRLTVVTGLDGAGRSRLAGALAGVLGGRCDGVGGLIEVDGAEFDIEPDLLEMLGLAAPEGDLTGVVTADDLLQAAGGGVTPARAGELDRLQRRLEELSQTRAVLIEESEARAMGAAATAEAKVGAAAAPGQPPDDSVAEQTVPDETVPQESVPDQAVPQESVPDNDEIHRLERRLAELTEQRAVLAGGVAAPGAGEAAEVEDARHAGLAAALARLESDASDERAHAAEAELEALHQQLDELRRRRAEIEGRVQPEVDETATDVAAAGLAERRAAAAGRLADSVVAVPVEVALVAFHFVRSWRAEPLREALELADRLERLAAEGAAPKRTAVPEWLRKQNLEQLEEAHSGVDEAEDRAGRRFGGGMARRRLEAARAVEQDLLAELGLRSYADYMMMRAGGAGSDPDAERRLATAKAALADAEAVWQEIEGQSEPDWPGRHAEEEALRTQAI